MTSLEPTTQAEANVPLPPRRWHLRIGLPFVLIGTAAGVLIATSWQALLPATHVNATIVAVRSIETNDPAASSDLTGSIQAPGWIEPDPFGIYVAALTQGVVKEVLVLDGDHIKAGQVVATLIDDDARIALSRAEAVLAQRVSESEAAQATLKAAQTSLRELIALDLRVAVAKEAVARREAEYFILVAAIASKKSERDALDDEYQRKKKLVEEGAVAEGPVQRLAIRLRGVHADIEGLEAQQRAAKAIQNAATAEVNAANRHRELLIEETLIVEDAQAALGVAMAAINHAQADREEAALALARTQIISPVSGTVMELLVSTGSMIRFASSEHAAHVVHLYDPEKLQVRADIPIADAAGVGVGQAAEIVIDLLPDTIFRGEVTRLVHRADVSKNTIEAKVRIIDPSSLLKPDMLARVRLLGSADDTDTTAMRTVDRVFVPVAALSDNNHVWVIDNRDHNRGTARHRSVRLGAAAVDGWREVIEGLLPGDAVITSEHALTDGAPVNFVKEVSS